MDKILKAEKIDFFLLVYQEVEKKNKDLIDDKEKESPEEKESG